MLNKIQNIQSLEGISLYDLMAEDISIQARLTNQKEVSIYLEDEKYKPLAHDKTHLYAWESLVYLAKQIISENDKIQREIENEK